MGFSEVEDSIAMKRCGSASIAKLTDFICAAQMAKAADALLPVKGRKPLCNDPNYKKRRNLGYDFWERNKQKKLEKKLLNEDDHAVHLLIPMIDNSKNTSRRCYEHTTLVPLESDEVEILLEVAFYCLGILLKTDVQELNDDRLEQLMSSFNGLDIVIGGIQHNNLTGKNKHYSWA
ncbi:Detected protein of confused Function [Hibiscus syriacus]|uniref:Detected protein of confused Function n=1 Tax=Hibiscus syriacus TaxID=106335 RepID=A0A6A2X274_HIBSY|nr:Detected protein of confused Function [Hibiscus syriacus]